MSTLKTTYIQHPSAESPAIELTAEGTVALPLSGIGDLADVDEGSGAVDGDVLTYDAVGDLWVPQGMVLPAGIGSSVVQTVKTDAFTTTSTSYVDVTDFTATITPSSDTSKILVIADVKYSGVTNPSTAIGRLVRDSTGIYVSANDITGHQDKNESSNSNGDVMASTNVFLDSPATTSAVTYKWQIKSSGGTTAFNSGRNANGASVSSITLIEVAA